MKTASLFLLRLSVALLILIWGVDKIVNPAHGARVAETFYLGVVSSTSLMPVLGIAEIVLAALVGLGMLRSVTLPLLAAVTGVTLLGVWRSILDPLGFFLEGSNLLFFPSLTVFMAVLVLIAFRADDRWALEQRTSA